MLDVLPLGFPSRDNYSSMPWLRQSHKIDPRFSVRRACRALAYRRIRRFDRGMRITKYEHAAVTIDDNSARLVIDPGSPRASLTDFTGVAAVVVTHAHADHCSPSNLQRIAELNPEVPIYAPAGVATTVPGVNVVTVSPGDVVSHGGFTLEFFGGEHAVIHESVPVPANVGVLVNGEFYYPGDSYALPGDHDVVVLAAPIGAPWLKIGEAMDFVLDVAPQYCFGTHDMTLSPVGHAMHHERLGWATQQGGGQYIPLAVGESIDL